jgi:predicted SprT family Zn-dependent metalloprotease
MDILAAHILAESLMQQHGLRGWTLHWNSAKTQCGSCSYIRHRITLSRPITELNSEEQVRDTILHEIAHALTPGEGHGWAWKAKAREIGARPVRCGGSETKAPERRYHLHCPTCNRVAARYHRRPRVAGYVHKLCKTPLQLIDTREVRSA